MTNAEVAAQAVTSEQEQTASSSSSSTTSANAAPRGHLSARGQVFASFITPAFENDIKVFSDAYEWQHNPSGLVNFGVAENALLRAEIVDYINRAGWQLEGPDLAYNNRLTTSQKLKEAIAHLYNTYPDGYPDRGDWHERKPRTPVEPEHIHIGSGAGNVLNTLAWSLCEKGDGVLLGLPLYNGFLLDWSFKAEAEIVRVPLPMPEPLGSAAAKEGARDWKSASTVELYEQALKEAEAKGIKTKVLLYCNPANPQGQILPRETTVALLRFAAKHKLHFVSDEIYSRTIYDTTDNVDASGAPAAQFHSVLSIDVEREAGLDPSYLHVVSSASKDFDANGFRLGLLLSQHNRALLASADLQNLPAQTSQPAGTIWTNWIRDTPFLEWFLRENRRRCALAYRYVTEWLQHHQIPYVPATAGHFFLVDLRRFLDLPSSSGPSASLEKQREAEQALADLLVSHKVFIATGAKYEHAVPGWFRFTYTAEPHALREGLARAEAALRLAPFAQSRPLLDTRTGGEPMPRPPRERGGGETKQGERRAGAAVPQQLLLLRGKQLGSSARPASDSDVNSVDEEKAALRAPSPARIDRGERPLDKSSWVRRLFCMS